MSPTLTLEIPFILLGRHDVLDPATDTPPIAMILQTLQQFCPTISIHSVPLEPSSVNPTSTLPPNALTHHAPKQDHDTQEQRHALTTSRNQETWLLHPSSQTQHTAASCLCPSETTRLNPRTWHRPLTLQRLGVPLSTTTAAWTRFAAETRTLLQVLQRAFVDFMGPVAGVRGEARYWDVVVGEQCFLKATVGDVRMGVGRRVVVLHAALERELDLLRSIGEVVRFVGVGRWAEWVLLRRMAVEKRDAWKGLGGNGGAEERVVRRFGEAEERYGRTKGRAREWWDVVRDMDGEEIVALMRSFCKDGERRLGVCLHRLSDGTHQTVIQGCRSTLDADYLLAYTELLARTVETAQHHTDEQLTDKLEDYQLYQPSDPAERFSSMLEFLNQDDSRFSSTAAATLKTSLQRFARPARLRSGHLHKGAVLPAARIQKPRESVDPFFDLRMFLAAERAKGRADMVGFIERYDSAGGYKPTPDEKLWVLLEAEEERWKGRNRGKKEGLKGSKACSLAERCESASAGGLQVSVSDDDEDMKARIVAWRENLQMKR